MVFLGRMRTKDKMDRATVEQVMDPRTRLILFKLLRRQLISEINGCISTGKEANVYHAKSPTGEDRAIKVNRFCHLDFQIVWQLIRIIFDTLFYVCMQLGLDGNIWRNLAKRSIGHRIENHRKDYYPEWDQLSFVSH